MKTIFEFAVVLSPAILSLVLMLVVVAREFISRKVAEFLDLEFVLEFLKAHAVQLATAGGAVVNWLGFKRSPWLNAIASILWFAGAIGVWWFARQRLRLRAERLLLDKKAAVNSNPRNSERKAMYELPIPALAATVGAVLFWLIAGGLKQGNDKLQREILAIRQAG